MSTRAYDYIVQVSDIGSFRVGNVVIGACSNAVAEIVSFSGSNIKVRMVNVYSEFTIGESLVSTSGIVRSINTFIDHSSNVTGTVNVFALPSTLGLRDSVIPYVDGIPSPRDTFIVNANNTIQFLPLEQLQSTSSTILDSIIFPTNNVTSLLVQMVTGNVDSPYFVANNLESYVETANSTILGIFNAPYIAEKNSSEQTPLVKLYTIYYPGDWYPPNPNGNPSKGGDGYPWAYEFPLRYAEVVGDSYSDFNYLVSFNNQDYKVTALDSGFIDADSSGRINETVLRISNFDGFIAKLVEQSNLAGYNSSNSTVVFVNGELVQNIDPRTVEANIHFNTSVAAERGTNASWDYSSTVENGDTWTLFKSDSRDLLDAVVEIKLTYAKFLDYWPEYSAVTNSTINSISVYSSTPYRVGDSVTSNSNPGISTIVKIEGSTIYLSDTNLGDLAPSSKLLIINPDADPQAFVEHIFRISRLDELDEFSASFSMTNWLSYFKGVVPKRKFFTTTCPFVYKGDQCKYPANGSGSIVGSNPPIQANGYFTFGNASTLNLAEDICSKTLTACSLRRNLLNFGGFPGASS
jgi:phage-related protein